MRIELDFCKDWFFHKGDLDYDYPSYKGIAYIGAKTERYHIGPASRNYYVHPDSYNQDVELKSETWQRVNVPHDYVIEGIPEKKYNCALGFVPYENAWYIKKFNLTSEDKNKRISLLFEGIATRSTIYLNGCLLKHNFSGYNTFEVDITDYVKYDEVNSLSVYVNTQEHEGWWYEGGGIYRPVTLIKTDLVSTDLYGVYVKPIKEENDWLVKIETTVRNDNVSAKKVKVVTTILDENGSTVASCGAGGNIDPKDKKILKYSTRMSDPALWSPDSPTLYYAKTEVYNGNTLVDCTTTHFGFRTLRIDANKGLFINDKHYKIKGVCGHADCGLMGKAVPDNIHRYKVQLMKQMGANGYRTTHYMQSSALMDELDKNGFIVMDETRWFESSDEGKAQLEILMRRDRNRPSVVFWSVGNEEPHHVTEEGRRIAQTLMGLAHKLDDTRFIMTAVCHSPDKATVYDELEAIGINYNWNMYEKVHEKYPTKGVFASECCATSTTRGWYFEPDPTRAFLPAYDRDSSVDWKGREFTWKFLDSHDWLLGGYQWIAFEHRGEAIWPRVCSQSGAIDLYMQKKDAFYQNQSHWLTTPMVHVLPHWNFPGLEGQPIRVVAYSNCQQVDLLVNGVSQGIITLQKHDHAEWQVDYQPGKIEVIAYNDGVEVARDEKITSGKGVKLDLILENEDICANGKDIALFTCRVLDENGNEVYDATPFVSFTAQGAGVVYSTGSDITDHSLIFSPDRRMRAGRITVAVKLGEKSGPLTLTAMSDGLLSARITIDVK